MPDITPAVLTLPFKRVIAIHSALVDLARRKLPSITVDLKVARRIDSLRVEAETFDKRQKALIAEHTGDDNKLERAVEFQQKLDALRDEVIEIPAPKSKITEADLPKAMKGDDGEKNAAGIGAIVADLAPEFFDLPEES